MKPDLAAILSDLRASDAGRQNRAFESFAEATGESVDWAYEVWDELLALLREGDNRQRAIAAQVLSSLANSDPKARMCKDVAALLAVTKDERFVTARHCLQSLWKVGVAGPRQRKILVEGLTERFKECAFEKNCKLIRYDILAVLRRIYDSVREAPLRTLALGLIESEPDPKYRKKYATLWRSATA